MTAPASNLAMRLGTAAGMGPIIRVSLKPGQEWEFSLLVVAVAMVGVQELFAMTHPGDGVSQGFGVLVSAWASVALYVRGDDLRVVATVLVVVPILGPLFTLVRLGKIETA